LLQLLGQLLVFGRQLIGSTWNLRAVEWIASSRSSTACRRGRIELDAAQVIVEGIDCFLQLDLRRLQESSTGFKAVSTSTSLPSFA
jgi:hypothetical protein